MDSTLSKCLRPYTYYNVDWCEMDEMAFMPAGQPYLRKGAFGSGDPKDPPTFALIIFLMMFGQLLFLSCLFSSRRK
jgi:hypothetical protein